MPGNLPVDAVPDVTNRQVQLNTVSPALGAEEIERRVTFPLESSLGPAQSHRSPLHLAVRTLANYPGLHR